MAVIGIPLYICATACPPVAAAMRGGLSWSGTDSPAGRPDHKSGQTCSLGNRALGCSLVGVIFSYLLLGLLVGGVFYKLGVDALAQIGAVHVKSYCPRS